MDKANFRNLMLFLARILEECQEVKAAGLVRFISALDYKLPLEELKQLCSRYIQVKYV